MKPPGHLVCFANPESPRISALRAALSENPGVRLEVVPWLDVLNGNWTCQPHYTGETRFRLESPGKNWKVEQGLLALGANAEDPEDPDRTKWARISRGAVEALSEDRGRILPMRQWQLGWSLLLQRIESRTGVDARWFLPPQDVLCMFDKAACQTHLERAGCPVPPSFGLVQDFDHLMHLMAREGCQRVFVKSCHGSSASGLAALESVRGDMQAFSTVALSGSANAPVLHNSRRVIRYRGSAAIRPLIDQICRLRATTQAWVPKSGWLGQRLDLRVVIIAGKSAHIVPRLSHSPFTTLQLGAKRGDAEALRKEVAEAKWGAMLCAAEAAGKAFPRSLYAGVDVLVTPGWSRALVLEVNAFGDFLPGALLHGRDTYTCELAAAGML